MKTIKNHRIILFMIVIVMGLITASCDQPTADQIQVQKEKSVTDIATSDDVIAPLSRFDARSRECPQPAVDIFLKLEGIDGESEDAEHEGEIDVLSWSWGVSIRATSTIAGRGPGRAKVNVQDISLTKQVDKASPELRRFAASGESIPEAVLTTRSICGDEQEYLVISMENVLVSSYQTGTYQGRTIEEVTLTLDSAEDVKRWKIMRSWPKN